MNVTLIISAALAGIAAPMRSKIDARATPKYRHIIGVRRRSGGLVPRALGRVGGLVICSRSEPSFTEHFLIFGGADSPR
jgi:hypothetical protein